ncbi:MAG: methionyl-tRNA formyltransferase [bacterium]
MHDYAFIGNDRTSLLFLQKVFEKRRPKYIITGEDRIEGRGRKLTPSMLASFAEEKSLKCFKTNNPNSAEFLQKISLAGAVEFFLVFSFGYYLKNGFLKTPQRMCVNIHPSLLPLYRGAAPLNRAIMNGDSKSGVTFFKMASKMDAGEIIVSEEIPLKRDETSLSLGIKAVEKAADIFMKFDWSADFPLLPQDDSRSTVAPKVDKRELLLDLTLNADEIKNRINGLSEYGIKCTINGRKLKIRSSSLEESFSEKDAGLIEIKDKRIIMYCRKGSISLNEIQPDGKAVMSAESYINGYKLKNGDKVCAEFLE